MNSFNPEFKPNFQISNKGYDDDDYQVCETI